MNPTSKSSRTATKITVRLKERKPRGIARRDQTKVKVE